MKGFILIILFLTSAVSMIASDSAVYKLCEKLQQDPNHIEAIQVVLSHLKNKNLNYEERAQLNSILVFKYLMTQKFDSCLLISEEQVLKAKKENNPYYEAKFYNLIGNTYFYLSNPKAANQYYLKGEFIANKHQYIDMMELFNHNLGAMSMENPKEDARSEMYLKKSIEYSKKNPHVKQDFAAGHYRLLASLYWRQKKFVKAEKIYINIIDECQKNNNHYQEAAALMFYSKLLIDQKKIKEGLDMSAKALILAKPFKSIDILSTAYSTHAQNLKAANMPDSAYSIMAILQELVRNNYQEGLNKQIGESAAKFKNAEIEYEKNVAIEKSKRQLQLYIGIFLFIILAGSTGALFYLHKRKTDDEKKKMKAILNAEEQERDRVSKELHDGIGQLLGAAKLNLHAFEENENKEILHKAIQLIDESATELRSVSHSLAPVTLTKNGLVLSIKKFLDSLKSNQVKISFHSSESKIEIENTKEIIIYRIIQECVSNAIKHAKAKNLFVSLDMNENQLEVMIEDDGQGFDQSMAKNNDGIGLYNMKVRTEYLNGTMEIDSRLNHGTVFSFRFPLK